MADSRLTDAASNKLAVEISRQLVTQLAPEELSLFRVASQQFQQNPDQMLVQDRASDHPLGFGVGEAAALLTPAALMVASSVISYLVEELRKTAADQSASFLVETVRKLFQKSASVTPQNSKQLPVLTPDQLAQIRAIVLKQARQARLSDPRAKALADATTGMLAISMGA